MGGQMNGWMDKQIWIETDREMDLQMDIQMDGCKIEGQMEGKANKWMDV